MRFSHAFEVTRTQESDWFDPLLNVDSRLFVDPFLIFEDSDQLWSGAHDRLVDFFNMVLALVAKSGLDRSSAHSLKAAQLLLFPEPGEFGLGYAIASTKGLGSGVELGKGILEAAEVAVAKGVFSVTHFEELMLLGDLVGADRISDITCNILKSTFIEYTQAICSSLGVNTATLTIKHARWSRQFERWYDEPAQVPIHPVTRKALLLTPSRFLRELPTVSPEEFWDWAWSNENERLRLDFNYEVAKHVDGATISRLARKHPAIVEKYLSYLELHKKRPYDVISDPSFEVRWWESGQAMAAKFSTATPLTSDCFCSFIEEIINEFKHHIENQDGWRLLWESTGPVSERLVQSLFRSAMTFYCKANNIDLSGEANAGRGPVDFKFSQGWRSRALVEIKLTNNSSFWHGIRSQLPRYMKAEANHCGYFVAIGFRDVDFEDRERAEAVRIAANEVSVATGTNVRAVFIDARRKPGASKPLRMPPRQ